MVYRQGIVQMTVYAHLELHKVAAMALRRRGRETAPYENSLRVLHSHRTAASPSAETKVVVCGSGTFIPVN